MSRRNDGWARSPLLEGSRVVPAVQRSSPSRTTSTACPTALCRPRTASPGWAPPRCAAKARVCNCKMIFWCCGCMGETFSVRGEGGTRLQTSMFRQSYTKTRCVVLVCVRFCLLLATDAAQAPTTRCTPGGPGPQRTAAAASLRWHHTAQQRQRPRVRERDFTVPGVEAGTGVLHALLFSRGRVSEI